MTDQLRDEALGLLRKMNEDDIKAVIVRLQEEKAINVCHVWRCGRGAQHGHMG